HLGNRHAFVAGNHHDTRALEHLAEFLDHLFFSCSIHGLLQVWGFPRLFFPGEPPGSSGPFPVTRGRDRPSDHGLTEVSSLVSRPGKDLVGLAPPPSVSDRWGHALAPTPPTSGPEGPESHPRLVRRSIVSAPQAEMPEAEATSTETPGP